MTMSPKERESLKLIDQEIQRLSEAIRRLRAQRNEVIPISRIPPELLGQIFSFIAPDSEQRFCKRWFSYSHVSRSWRDIALDTPRLWSNIPYEWPSWTKAMLERSKRAKLTICAHIDFDDDPQSRRMQSLNVSLSRTTRIRELDLRFYYSKHRPKCDHLRMLFSNVDPGSLQNLVILRLRNTNSAIDPYFIPKGLCVGTQRVQHLEIEGCHIPWDSAADLLGGLLSLKMQYVARPTTIQLLKALRSMPGLRLLHMHYSLPSMTADSPNPGLVEQPVLLPYLEELLLYARNMNEITNIFSHVAASGDTILDISCVDGYIDDTSKFALALESFLKAGIARQTPASRICSLVVDSCKHQHIHALKAYTKTAFKFSSPQIALSLHDTDVPLGAFLEQIMPSLEQPCLHLRRLVLRGSDVTSSNFYKAFGRFRLVTRITIDGPIEPLLVAMLAEHKHHNSLIFDYQRVLLPKLRVLQLFFPSVDAPALLSKIRDFLMERYERNAAIDKVILMRRISPATLVELLREVVVDVDVHEDEYADILTEASEDEEVGCDNDGL